MKAARFVYICALLLWSGAAFSIEGNHRMMQGLSAQFSSPVLMPTKYYAFVREMSRLDANTAVLKELWDVELPANPTGDRIVFLPPVSGKYEYIETSGTILKANGEREKLLVDFKSFDIEDSEHKRITVKTAFLKIPKTDSPSRLSVQFSMKGNIAGGLEQFGLTLELAPETPVKDARLILMPAFNELKSLEVDLRGFTERKSPGKPDGVKEYALSKEWLGTTLGGIESAPKVIVSYAQWSTIAAAHARFYKAELANQEFKDIRKFDADIQEIVGTSNLSNLEKAYRLYKWIGQNLSYALGAFSLRPESKYTPYSIDNILTTRKGSCMEFAMLYLKLLSLAGIYAEPVEVNGSDEGPLQLDSMTPKEFAFNHVIVYIPALNLYVDPTTSIIGGTIFTLFGTETAAYSSIYGLNLFSGKLIQISPDQVQNKISVKTTISNIDGRWIGSTTWQGSGNTYRTMSTMEQQRERRKARGQKIDRVFTDNKTSLLADSWKFEQDDMRGRATLNFSFVMGADWLDLNGPLNRLPKNVMTAAVFKYELDILSNYAGSCFGSELSEETIELNGQHSVAIDHDLQDVNLSGVNSTFSQKISISREGLKLHRTFSLNEKRATCPLTETELQKTFYKKIGELKTRTHPASEAMSAK